MKVSHSVSPMAKIKTDLFVCGLLEDADVPKLVDKFLDSAITDLLKSKRFKPEFGKVYVLNGKGTIKTVLLVGLGKRGEFSLEKLRKAGGVALRSALELSAKDVSTNVQDVELKAGLGERSRAFAEGAILGLYKFIRYKSENGRVNPESLTFVSEYPSAEIKSGVEVGRIVSESVCYSRDLINMPANDATPESIAKEAERLAKEFGLKVKVYRKAELEKMGFGALLGVGQGSVHSPVFVVLEYNSSGKDCIALVGKGVTFDSGGTNLKPTGYIDDMKQDKAGACVVLGVLRAAALLKLNTRVVGVLPLAENMIGSKSIKPGDVLKSYSGKTIEVTNTDAEGRLILADALAFTEKQYRPKAVIDIATLTGACVVALGWQAAGLFGNDDKLVERIKKAGDTSGERVWQLPIWDDYKDCLDSDVADLKNCSKERMEPGAINGAMFLNKFAGSTWAHLDIAGPAWTAQERAYTQKGATGYGVRLLTQLLIDWK